MRGCELRVTDCPTEPVNAKHSSASTPLLKLVPGEGWLDVPIQEEGQLASFPISGLIVCMA